MALYAKDLIGLTAGEALDRIAKEPDPEHRARLMCEHAQLRELCRGKLMMRRLTIYDTSHCRVILAEADRQGRKWRRVKVAPDEVWKEERPFLHSILAAEPT